VTQCHVLYPVYYPPYLFVNSHTGQFWLADSPVLASCAYSDLWAYYAANAGAGGGRIPLCGLAGEQLDPLQPSEDGSAGCWQIFASRSISLGSAGRRPKMSGAMLLRP